MWREEVVRQVPLGPPGARDAVREVYRRRNGTHGFRWRDRVTGQFVRAPDAPPRPPRSREGHAAAAVPAAAAAAPPDPPLADPVIPQAAASSGGPQAAQALHLAPLPSAPPPPLAPGPDVAPTAQPAPFPFVDSGASVHVPVVAPTIPLVSIAHIVDAGGSLRWHPGGAIDITLPPPPAPEVEPTQAALNWVRVVEKLRRYITRQQRRRAGHQAALLQGVGWALGWGEHRRSLLRWRRACQLFLAALRLVLRTVLERPRDATVVGLAIFAGAGRFLPGGEFLGSQGANATAPGDPPLPALGAPPRED